MPKTMSLPRIAIQGIMIQGILVLSFLFSCSDSTDTTNVDVQGGTQQTMVPMGGMSINPVDMSGPACTGDDACPPGSLCDTELGACRPGCLRDEDCGQDKVCYERFCESLEPCGEDGACGNGLTCGCRNQCVPQVGDPCQRDLQCDVNDYCDTCEGQCKPRVAPCGGCTNSASCERRDDICAPIGARGFSNCLRACTGQATCDLLGPGYRCDAYETGMFCLPTAGECASLTACTTDGDCESGAFCNERSICQTGCTDDTSCPEGQLCQGLRCGAPCNAGGMCTGEAVCEADGRCKVPNGCQTSRDCDMAETYCDVDAQRCVAGCQVEQDCGDATKECVGGTCRPRGCAASFQCSFGEVCDLTTRQCVQAEGRHCESGCDPMASTTSCGDGGARCLSLQDQDENPIGDFCFEPCQDEPNVCPQGYRCTPIQDPETMVEFSLCIRQCEP